MANDRITVSANGLETFQQYVDVLRKHADELAANGMDYDERDRRAEPITTTLLIYMAVNTFVTTALGEVIKKLVANLCDSKKKTPNIPNIQMTINRVDYNLPQDQTAIEEKIDSLTKG
jgi:hypothetical protein